MKRAVVVTSIFVATVAVAPVLSQSLHAEVFRRPARAVDRARRHLRPRDDDRRRSVEQAPSFYVGAASGGVWKTVNGGASWQPVFDTQGSYSIGWITLDPKHPNVVWVGTGERNSQRSVAYGDGVYKSEDGGRSWTNVGLKNSEHIGRIVIDPKDSDTVYVAAQGPLWARGRRPRPLQDHRRRQDVEAGAEDLRAHRRHATWWSIRAIPTSSSPRRINAAVTSSR